MNLTITRRPPFHPPVEFVERKGSGHPDTICDHLAEDLARQDPRGAAEWLVSNEGEGAAHTIDDVIRIWASQDQGEAVAYYETMPRGDFRTNALRGLAIRIAMLGPHHPGTVALQGFQYRLLKMALVKGVSHLIFRIRGWRKYR